MRTNHRYLLVLAAAAALSACSSVKLDDQAPVESRSGAAVVPGNQNAARDAAANSQTRVAPVTASGGDMAGLGNVPRIVYFDFDSYVVKDEFRPVVEANAKVLTTQPARKMAVQGHTDDRGSSEYNLALGQRRAEAVVKSLTLMGVKPSQLEATSFGKERPAVQGENEEAWAKNRRAELMAAQ
jgi:peptidoglycan-associated lipoprotein